MQQGLTMGQWRYWEDLEAGEETLSAPLTVDEADMMEFARKYDPQFFHTDPASAGQSPFGGVIASGLYTASLWRIMDHQANGSIAFVCGVAWENVRWPVAVRGGDVLRARSVLRDKRMSGSRTDAGVITLHHEVLRDDDKIVLSFDSIAYVRLRSTGSPAAVPLGSAAVSGGNPARSTE